MSAQMFFAFSYVPCVAFQGMSLAADDNKKKLYSRFSLFFGALTIWSYLVFLSEILL